MKKHWKRHVLLLLFFAAGYFCGTLRPDRTARAGQEFGPEDVKVPADFLNGGDRQLSVLEDILDEVQAQTAAISAMREDTAAISQNTAETAKRLAASAAQ